MFLHLQHAQEYQKQMYDAEHNTMTTISVWDEVLLKNMKNTHRMGGKLDIRWTGPYEDIGKMRYKLKWKNSETSSSLLQIKAFNLFKLSRKVLLSVSVFFYRANK